MSVEQFLEESVVKKDFLEKMTYFWFWSESDLVRQLEKNWDSDEYDYTIVVEKNLLETLESRENVCSERVGYYLNYNTWDIVWEEESEWWASFYRNWHVTYKKWWEKAEDDVSCFIDIVNNVILSFLHNRL